MKKIFYIDPQSYNNLAIYDKNLISNMSDFLIDFYGNKLFKCSLPEKINFYPIFNYSRNKNSLSKAFSYIKSIIKIANKIKFKRPQVVHIQWIRLWAVDYLFIKWVKSKGIKIVFTAHNILPHDTDNKYFNQYKKYYEIVDHIIVHDKRSKIELETSFLIPGNKITVIRHGALNFELNEADLTERIHELKNELKITDTDIVFSSLGIQSLYKGVDLIIDVWNSNPLFYENPQCKLLLIGKSKGIDYNLIKDKTNVIIRDLKISDLDFQAYLRLSSVVLLPYRRISQSGVLLNAISSEIPVVVTDVGGLCEPLEAGNIGWNIGESNFENLYNCLTNLIHNPYEINNKRNFKAFDNVKQMYDWSAVSFETESLYKSLINNG